MRKGLFLLIIVIISFLPVRAIGVRVNRPKAPVVPPFPKGFVPLGPANGPMSIALRELKGLFLPEAQHAWPGTIWAVPPTYYHLRTGNFIGAFAFNGKILTTTPVNIWQHKNRTLVVVRTRSFPGVQDVAYHPTLALRRRTRYLQGSTIRQFGIRRDHFHVVTMDCNDAAESSRLAERSGLAATPREIRAYYRTKKSTFAQIRRDLQKAMGNDVVILSADGGATMGKPYERRSRYAVTVGRRQTQQYARTAQ